VPVPARSVALVALCLFWLVSGLWRWWRRNSSFFFKIGLVGLLVLRWFLADLGLVLLAAPQRVLPISSRQAFLKQLQQVEYYVLIFIIG
jgi:hypothetical protein